MPRNVGVCLANVGEGRIGMAPPFFFRRYARYRGRLRPPPRQMHGPGDSDPNHAPEPRGTEPRGLLINKVGTLCFPTHFMPPTQEELTSTASPSLTVS